MKWLTIAVIVVVLVVATAAAITAIEMHRQQIESFYRGSYAMCMVFNAYVAQGGGEKFVDCNAIITGGYDKEWHERDTKGFEWPPNPIAD